MTRLRAWARQFAFAHVGGTALVLIYHRVVDLDSDPQLLAVSSENFDAQMELLGREYNPLSLHDLIDGLQHKRVKDGSVVVTFDDGYADNLTCAAPILEAHGVPATVFVSSGYVGSDREFWWDELESLVLAPETLPSRIEIELPGGHFSADVEQAHEVRDLRWNVLAADSSPRHALYRRLADWLRPLPADTREAALVELRAQCHASSAPRDSHRQLSAAQVSGLDALEVVAVGGHTVNHSVLSARSLAEQRAEIEDDRDALARLCDHPIPTFSYPYGSLEDYTAQTVELVRSAGYRGACSNHVGVVKPWTDPFRIPRVIVRDWTAERFGRELESWFDDPR